MHQPNLTVSIAQLLSLLSAPIGAKIPTRLASLLTCLACTKNPLNVPPSAVPLLIDTIIYKKKAKVDAFFKLR